MAETTGIVVEEERERLVAALRMTLRHSLGSSLVSSSVDPCDDRPNWQVDWSITAVVIPLLLVASIALLAYPLPPEFKYRQLVPLQVWGTAFLWLVTWLAWLTKRSVIDRFVRELLPVLSVKSIRRVEEQLGEVRKRQRWPLTVAATVPVSGVVGLAMARDLGWFTCPPCDWPRVTMFWIWLLSYALVFAAAIKLGIAATFHGDVVSAFDAADLADHPLTPDQAPLIRSTLRVSSEMLGFAAVTALYLATLVLWLRGLRWFLVTDLTICLLASIGTGAILYVRVNRRLVHLIEDRRGLTLGLIEAELWPLTRPPVAAGSDAKEIERLSALHAQVLGRNVGLGWRERLKLALPAIPPLLALLNAERFADLLAKLATAWIGP